MPATAPAPRLFVPTPAGAVEILSLTVKTGSERSRSAVLRRDSYEPLRMSGRYREFVAETGPLGMAGLAAEGQIYILQLSADIDGGDSWNLPVLLHHLVEARALGLGPVQEAGPLTVFATGSLAFDPRLSLESQSFRSERYALEEKVDTWLRAAAPFTGRIAVLLPAQAEADDLDRAEALARYALAGAAHVVRCRTVGDAVAALKAAAGVAPAPTGESAAVPPETAGLVSAPGAGAASADAEAPSSATPGLSASAAGGSPAGSSPTSAKSGDGRRPPDPSAVDGSPGSDRSGGRSIGRRLPAAAGLAVLVAGATLFVLNRPGDAPPVAEPAMAKVEAGAGNFGEPSGVEVPAPAGSLRSNPAAEPANPPAAEAGGTPDGQPHTALPVSPSGALSSRPDEPAGRTSPAAGAPPGDETAPLEAPAVSEDAGGPGPRPVDSADTGSSDAPPSDAPEAAAPPAATPPSADPSPDAPSSTAAATTAGGPEAIAPVVEVVRRPTPAVEGEAGAEDAAVATPSDPSTAGDRLPAPTARDPESPVGTGETGAGDASAAASQDGSTKIPPATPPLGLVALVAPSGLPCSAVVFETAKAAETAVGLQPDGSLLKAALPAGTCGLDLTIPPGWVVRWSADLKARQMNGLGTTRSDGDGQTIRVFAKGATGFSGRTLRLAPPDADATAAPILLIE